MNNENDVIDSLLKEHAKMKQQGDVDEQFLKELEDRIDQEELHAGEEKSAMKNTVVPLISPDRASGAQPGRKWVFGLGVAACAAFGFMGYQMWSGQKSDIVLSSGAADKQITNAEHTNKEYYAPSREQEHSGIKGKSDAKAAPPVLAHSPREELADATGQKPQQLSKDYLNSAENTKKRAKNNQRHAAPMPSKKMKPEATFGDSLDEMARKGRRGSLVPAPAPVPSPVADAERYGKLIENKFITPLDKETARSTFAVDVDTASYANLRRMIQSNRRVPADAVRIEEMVNYFDYHYPQPKGEHPFAVQVDSAACPWNEKNRLVRVAIQGKDIIRENRPASNVVFLLDVSGSMNRANKLPLLKESMKYLLEELNEKDTVSIVVYAGASGLALPATHVTAEGRKAIMNSLDKLSAGGSTAGGQGIKLAYKVAKENFVKKGINRVILATDGDFNVGVSNTNELKNMVKEKAKTGVYLSVLGFGSGNINDDMLETITNNGNGNYSYIDSIKEGRKVLLEDMMGTIMTIAKDVKVQVEFNPEKVQQYRLIGYSNRVLPNSAFRDKTADAGEIGAGHTVTAFYEVVPGKAADKAKEGALRFPKKKETPELEIAEEHKDKLLFVELAYKKPDQTVNDESTYFLVTLNDEKKSIDQADDDFKFASSVALLGMVLRDSDFRGEGDLDLVEKLATQGKGNDGKGYREEFLKLVQKLKQRK